MFVNMIECRFNKVDSLLSRYLCADVMMQN